MKKKTVALLMACVMALGVAVGGTMAWLTDKSGDVVNTFTVGDINIDLKEHDYITADEVGTRTDVNKQEYQITEEDVGGLDMKKEVEDNKDYLFVPGDTLPKDPFVTVKKDSEACWLFVKVVENNNIYFSGKNAAGEEVTEKALIYDVDEYVAETNEDGWKPVEGKTNYWYRKVDKSVNNQTFAVLKGDEVKFSEFITKDSALETAKATLTFTAAAVQQAHIDTVEAAWAELPEDFTPATP